MVVQSRWKKQLLASLALAGLTCGTMSSAAPQRPAPAESNERIVTVQDLGKPGQKCRVLRSWRLGDGAQAYEVQSLENGEYMTVVESGPPTTLPGPRPGTKVQMRATRIYHWGRHDAPPPGAPIPPGYVEESTAARRAAPVEVSPRTSTARTGNNQSPVRLPPQPHGRPFPQDDDDPPIRPTNRERPPQERDTEIAPAANRYPVEQRPAVPPPQPEVQRDWRPVPEHVPAPLPAAVPVQERPPIVEPVLPPPILTAPPAAPVPTPPPSLPGHTTITQTPPPPPLPEVIIPPERGHGRPAPRPILQPVETTPVQTVPSSVVVQPQPAPVAPPPVQVRPIVPESAPQPPPVQAALPVVTQPEPPRPTPPVAVPEPVTPKVRVPQPADIAPPSVQIPPVTISSLPQPPKVQPTPEPMPPVPEPTPPKVETPPPPPPKVEAPVSPPKVEVAPTPPPAPIPEPVALPPARVEPTPVPPPPAPLPEPTPQAPALPPTIVVPPGNRNTDNTDRPSPPSAPPMPVVTMPVEPAAPEPAAPSPVVPVAPEMDGKALEEQLNQLRDGLLPSEREHALVKLAGADLRKHPHVVQALVTAARTDPAATVRVSCLRALVKHGANTPPVLAAIEELAKDKDIRVRSEAEWALGQLQK